MTTKTLDTSTSSNKAIELINNLVQAEVELVNTQGGRGFVGAEKRERKAVVELFRALTNEDPSVEQISEMTYM